MEIIQNATTSEAQRPWTDWNLTLSMNIYLKFAVIFLLHQFLLYWIDGSMHLTQTVQSMAKQDE